MRPTAQISDTNHTWLRRRTWFWIVVSFLTCASANAQTSTITSPINAQRIDLNQTGDIIEVSWDYTGNPLGFSLYVNGANIGFSCSWFGGSGSCFFDATDTVCSPVLQIRGSFLPGGVQYSSPIQVFFYRGNDPASFSCLPNPPQCASDQTGSSVGGPINVVTGNMHFEVEDVVVPSPLPIRVSRRYDTQPSYSGPMGVGVRHRYDVRLECGTDPNGLGQNCKYTDAENNVTYQGMTAAGYSPAWYSIATISFNGSQLTDPHGLKYNFSGTTLSSIQDRNGNTLTFGYDTGKLVSITDTFGRQVTFGYTGNLVTSVTRPDAEQILYGYTTGRLTSATYPDGVIFTYEYTDAAHPDNLTAIKDKYGHVVESWTYDSLNRATGYKKHGDVDKLTIAYDTPSIGSTRVTDVLGNQTTYTIDPLKKVVTDIVGPCQSCAGGFNEQHFVWDSFHRITQITDGRGIVTEFQWDNSSPIKFRNLTRRIEAKNTSLERTTYFCYDANFNFVTTTKRKSVGTCSISDSCGISTTDHTVVINNYNGVGDLTSREVKGCEGAVAKTYTTTYMYNGKGQLLEVNGPRTDATPDDKTTNTYYPISDVQQYGFLATVTNALGHVTEYQGYDSMGRPGTIEDPNDVETIFSYDEMGRVASTTIVGSMPAENIVTSYTYDDHVGHLATLTNPRNFVTTYTEDTAHRLTDVTDPEGNVRHTDYDLMSRRIREEFRDDDATVHRFTNFANDAFGRVEHVCFTGTVPDCPSAAVHTNLTYDGNGNLLREEDPLSHPTDYTYDNLDRLKTVTQTVGASSLVTTYDYDVHDNPKTVVDPKGVQTDYTNSDTGWRLSATSPDAGTTNLTYDAAGNLITSADTVPVTVTRSYDSLNRLLTVTYPTSSLNVTYSYDAVDSPPGSFFNIGRRTGMTDLSGTSVYHYDRRGLLKREEKTIGSRTYTTGYEYDKAGNRTQLRYPTESPLLRQGQVDYTYDDADRISLVTTQVNGTTTTVANTFSYKPYGPRTAMTFGNSLIDARSYGTRYQLGTWTLGSLLNYTHAFNDDLNLTGRTDNLNGANNRVFGYDEAHRLTQAAGPWGAGTACAGGITYTYDLNGNRLCRGEDATATTYQIVAGRNRLDSETTGGTTTTFSYDGHGNTTGATITPPGSTRTYQYNQADRLGAVVDSGPTTIATYTYDGDGRRALSATGGLTTHFLYDSNGRLLSEIVPASGTGKDYLYLQGDPLARVDWTVAEIALTGDPLRVTKAAPNVRLDWTLFPAGSNQYVVRRKQVVNPADKTFNGSSVIAGLADPIRTYDDPVLNDANRYDYRVFRKTSNDVLFFYHTDHLGTPIAMTNTAGTFEWRAEHRPFSGIHSLPFSSIANNLRFPGQYFDVETARHQNVFRMYDPRLGRFVEPDPLGLATTTNLYAYVNNLPTVLIDPWGLCCTDIDRTRDLIVVLGVLGSTQDQTFLSQVCTGRLFQSGGGCGLNADFLVTRIQERVKCYETQRVDAGPRWLGGLLGASFQYSRLIPHSFVKLSPVDSCEPCRRLPDIAADNYDGIPVLATFSGGWAPL